MELLHHSISKATTSLIYDEHTDTSIEIEAIGNDITYLADGKSFIFSSERSGFKHLYVGEIATGKYTAITFYGARADWSSSLCDQNRWDWEEVNLYIRGNKYGQL
jgi:hypothetical protein